MNVSTNDTIITTTAGVCVQRNFDRRSSKVPIPKPEANPALGWVS